MKTKYLLFSAIFAAAAVSSCSNEEFVENAGIETGGEKVAISITAQKGSDEASTRLGIDVKEDGGLGPQFWEANDMLGGLLYTAVDGTAMLTNYPFTPANKAAFDNGGKPESMEFTTPTAVSKGTYVFYTPYNKKHVSNAKFEVELSDRQEMDPANPTKHLGDNNFMIAPAVSLEGIAYGDVNELPISFRSIYNLTRISIKLNKANEDVTIQRIVIKDATSATTLLKTKSQIVPSQINALVKATADNFSDGKPGSGSGQTTEILTTVGEIDAAKAEESDYKLASEALEVETAHVTQTGVAPAIVLAIKDGKTLKAGETFDAYVLLPAGDYESNGLNLDIYTDKGICEQKIRQGTGEGQYESLIFNASKSKKLSCELNFVQGNNNIKLPTIFDIASDQDWADAVAYVEKNFNAYGNTSSWSTPTFNLLKEVKGLLPAYAIAVEGKLTLTGENTLNAVAYDLTEADVVNEGTLTLAGGTSTAAKTFTVKSLENKGTVKVGKTSKLVISTTLKNAKDIINEGEVEVTTTTDNGSDEEGAAVATITNTGKFTATTALTNNKSGVINVNYTAATTAFTLSAASSSAGAINIADKATLTASTAALTNTGVITLNDAAILAGGTTLDNDGGTIVITDPSKAYNLTVPASGKSGVIKTTVSTKEGITAAQGKIAGTANNLINAIELTKSIKLVDNLNLGAATNLSLAAGVKLEILANKTVTCKNLIVSGAGASVAPYDPDGGNTPKATVTADGIKVEKAASLIVAKGLKVGDACVALTVGEGAALTNNGDIAAAASGASDNAKMTVVVEAKGSILNAGVMTKTFLEITTNEGSIKNTNATAIEVAGGMVGSMEGKFSFITAP